MVITVEYFYLYIFFTFSIILFIFLKKIYVSTGAMAVVMSLGITTQGVLLNFFGNRFFYSIPGRFISIVDLALWSSFIFSFLLACLNKKFKELHYSNPINRFGIGTWVAGTSICGILLDKQFNEWVMFVKILLSLNVGLWAFYIWVSLGALTALFKKGLTHRVHGVLLLTTVSTQSIVLLASTVYKNLPISIALFFTIFGVSFYIVSALLIIKRYSKLRSWSIRMDWNNTNCILHGALSITGLACLVSHLLTKQHVMIIWICAAIVFLMIEMVEFVRLFFRIKYDGWKQAIFIYDVSQWSRVFTFAMFYTFTYLSQPNPSSFSFYVQKLIIISGIWVICALVIFEIGILVKSIVEHYPRKWRKRSSPSEIHSSF
jgi:hypothetical protein